MTDDARFTAVLDEYHRLIEERTRTLEGAPFNDGRERFMPVGKETGQLLAVLARSLEAPRILELGTSFGYSTLWLASAAKTAGGRVTTIEKYEEKTAFARQMSEKAGLSDVVDFLVGDALEIQRDLSGPWDFVLIDHWKDLYLPSYDLLKPALVPGAILVADNMLRAGQEQHLDFADAVRATDGMDSVVLPVGSGILVARLGRAVV
ncbi:O-methyltransferase [uncultured Roseibium sp.]|uniref:O-methyltransferase n=1 Tax=uncultured Roseibium sp. TaxID=1936171 RepID=UPI0032164C62